MDERPNHTDQDANRPGAVRQPGGTTGGENELPFGGGSAALEKAISEHVRAYLPDRRLLVLMALAGTEREHLLDERERAELKAAQPRLEAELAKSPALADVLGRIAGDASEFEQVWSAAAGTAPTRSGLRRAFSDRPALNRRFPTVLKRTAFATALAAAVVVAVLLLPDRDPAPMVITGQESLQEVDLADGSTVRLTPGSTLTYRRPRGQNPFDRNVELSGSAYFVVAPGAGVPFVVRTAEATATVLGTRFGVVSTQGGTDVVLASGSVSVSSSSVPGHVVTLSPGTMSRVPAGSPASEPVAVDVVEALEWTGLFVFRGETYERIAGHLSRHYDVAITVAPEIASERQTGTFDRNLGLPEILATMERSWGFTVQGDTERGFILKPVP